MILLINTAEETGTVAIANRGEILFTEVNTVAKEHASWLHAAIGRILTQAKITLRELEAVSVIAGPGSYTGLRVGMAAAKGFCFALKIPLFTQNTLRVMAESMKELALEKNALICPMIDARRDEVFTALYAQGLTLNAERLTPEGNPSTVNRQPSTNNGLLELLRPQALILDKNAFENHLSNNSIVFFGTGANKWEKICTSPHAIFQSQINVNQAFANLSQLDFESGNQADAIYAEPVYLKEFFSY